MNVLTFERIWDDKDFFEVEVVAQSEIVRASVRSYTTKESINELALKLSTFPHNIDDRYVWENGRKGDGYPPFVSLEFWCNNKGHTTIEVYMEIDDGASYSRHNCCFFIKTEIGLLNSFGKSLVSLNEGAVGKRVSLVPMGSMHKSL